jgi:hypothetical protein
MKLRVMALLCAATQVGLSGSVGAQWLTYPTPGIPRLPNGAPNFSAPVPMTVEGRPDISGLWKASANYVSDLVVRAKVEGVVLQPWADALYRLRRETSGRDDPSARCVPGGVPRTNLVTTFYPFRIATTPGRVIILYEAIHGWREIFADGRGLPKEMNPTWMGYSIGRWEGDAFVVETTGFHDKGWLDNYGLPSSDKLHVTERFRRKDFGHMDLEITIADPGAYVRPWTFTLPLAFQADTEMLEYVCNENNKYFDIIPK